MKLQDIKVKKKTKPKSTPEAINPALSFESIEVSEPIAQDPIADKVAAGWNEFKQNAETLKPIPQRVNENLRNWFKEKWVRFGPDGKIRGECGGRSEGEGKPKCLPASKAHSLGKKGRASAAARKRREDPNPERSGAAINVATKKKTKEAQEYCPECGGSMYPETMINEKKDACYYKVKSRYKVWPSAYASGALVRCRKKGAKNWGSKSKNESVDESQLDEKWSEKYKRSINCDNPRGFSQRAHCQGRKKNEDQQLDEKCWDGYQQQGMKKKGNRMVPNCVPTESVNESRMKDLAMDLKDLSDGEFFEKYKKSKGQMQSSLEPMYVVKDPASYNDDDFYAYDPNTKILRSTWSSNSVGRWASEADAQRKGLTIVRGMRAKNLGLKVKRRLQGMLEAKVTQNPSGTYDIKKAKTWNPDPAKGTLSGSKRNIPGALVSLAKQAMGFDQRYNTADVEADPRLKRHVSRFNDDDWIVIDPTTGSFVGAKPRGTQHHRDLTMATSRGKIDWNKVPGVPLPPTLSTIYGGQPYVAIPGHIANQRRIAEDITVTEDEADPYVVYVNAKPIGKFDTPEEAKRTAEQLHAKMPKAYIDIRKTECTDVLLKTIAENENLYV